MFGKTLCIFSIFKDFLSESWEESRLKDWDDSKLKELLDEAYSYKNPRDKENKSKTFLVSKKIQKINGTELGGYFRFEKKIVRIQLHNNLLGLFSINM